MENGNLIFKKIIDVLREVPSIGKDKKNQQQGYSYRGIDDMYNVLHSLFAKNGIFITSEKIQSTREERKTQKGGFLMYSIMDYKFTFWAEDGSSVSSIITGEAMDSADKASNKAISAALKYALMQMFLIPTNDLEDADAFNHEPKPKENDLESTDLLIAIDDMNRAMSEEDCKEVWSNWKVYQMNPDFIKAKDEAKQRLKKAS